MKFDNPAIARREFLLALLAGLTMVPVNKAQADDKGGGGGKGGHDDSGGGGGDGGGDDSGGGGDDSGGGGDDGGGGGNDDGASGSTGQGGNHIRDSVRTGDSRPLRDILASVRKSYKGEVVHVGLVKSAAGLVYKIRMIDDSNRLIDIRVDARSGKILSAKAV